MKNTRRVRLLAGGGATSILSPPDTALGEDWYSNDGVAMNKLVELIELWQETVK